MDGETAETVSDLILGGSKITADGDCSQEIKRRLLLGRKVMTNNRQHTQKQRHYFANKGPSSQGYAFSSSHIWMWELDHKESWAPKNWCFWTVAFEKTLESPLDSKEIKPVNPKGYQPWIFTGRIDAEVETLILLLQEGGPLPGPQNGLLSNTQKWIVRGDTCADKARDFCWERVLVGRAGG